MTSSPAAGLLVVPLVTVPVRVWAVAEARAREMIEASRVDIDSLLKTTPLDLYPIVDSATRKSRVLSRPGHRGSLAKSTAYQIP